MMRDRVRIGPVAPAHVTVLAELYSLAFDEPFTEPVVREMLAMPGSWGLIASAPDEQPVGYVLARSVVGETEILTFGVVPALRRNGIGAALLQATIAEARRRGGTELFLEVAEDNPGAFALYRGAGFTVVGRRQGYYRRSSQRRVAARIMRLILQPNPDSDQKIFCK